MPPTETTRFVRMRALADGEPGLRMFTFEGVRFTAARGWVSVSEAAAGYLALLRVRPDHPEASLAFEVWTPVAAPSPSAPCVVTLADDAEGANAPSGQPLLPDARASEEPRERREAAEGGPPVSLVSARGTGSPPGVAAIPSDGAMLPTQELPPGDPAPAAANVAWEIAEGSLPAFGASAPDAGSSPEAVDDAAADAERGAAEAPPHEVSSAKAQPDPEQEGRGDAESPPLPSSAPPRDEGAQVDAAARGGGGRGGRAPGGRGRSG